MSEGCGWYWPGYCAGGAGWYWPPGYCTGGGCAGNEPFGTSAGGRGGGGLAKIPPNCAAAGLTARLPQITSKRAAKRIIEPWGPQARRGKCLVSVARLTFRI